MDPKLSPQERQALEQRGGATPIAVVDDHTNAVYYLISLDQYEKIKTLLDVDPFAVPEAYAAQEQALGKAGWDDPRMDVYNNMPAEPQRTTPD